ncbi:MAG TPA: 50S ribosomal protein L30 [Candidatus Krumholzibacteria bacterium]|nr:50S ribosomal protein L30 [Candidatus Krumholzibacteria bacterium]
MAKTIRITQIRSLSGSQKKMYQTMEALGFHRTYQTIEKADTPQIRGMLHQVRHLVKVEEA